MSKNGFEGLTDILNSNIHEPIKQVTHDAKTLKGNHTIIAEEMVKDFDNHKPYVEKSVEYPFLEVVGPRTKFEINHVKREGTTEEAIPLMMKVKDKFVRLGSLDLNYTSLTDLLSIYSYQLYLHTAKDEKENVSESLLLTVMLL